MKYAIIAISGSQFKVQENDILSIDLQEAKEGDRLSTNQVLLTSNEGKVKVGTPTVKDSAVEYEVIKNYQGKKIDISTYKAKSRYRRHLGFRPQLTEIKITKIIL